MNFCKVIGSGIKKGWKVINVVREIVVNLTFLLIILLIWGGWNLVKEQKTVNKPNKNGILVFDVQGSITDHVSHDKNFYALQQKLYGNSVNKKRENSLFEITEKLEQAKNDPTIKGIVLKLDNFTGADLPALEYIGKYLTAFKQNNKLIYAISNQYNQSQYYLASFANKIYLPPQGVVHLYGLSTNNFYFKTLLDNLKVNTHVFRVGTYKSAVEPLIRNDMSTEARENTYRWMNGMWDNYANDVATNRQQLPNLFIPKADIFLSQVKSVNGDLTEYALQYDLVDKIAPYYQFEADMQQAFNNEDDSISIYDYQLVSDNKETQTTKPEIALVFVNGTIAEGENSNNNAGSDSITEQLAAIRKNDNVKAVIIRVNSPGGSVTASEAIRNEIQAIRNQNIPVVISMGGMAASGGYWISTASDYIIASKNTITGSIGIFGIIPTFEKSLAHIGVYTDGVSTSPLADSALTKDLSNEFNQLMQMNIENGYQTFIKLVAEARQLSIENVDRIAQGQVWLGQEAKNRGLVDQIGDFDDALAKAAELANITDYQITTIESDSSWLDSLLFNISASLPKSSTEMIYQHLPVSKSIQAHINLLNTFNDPQYRYVYCLNCADVGL